MLPISIVEKDGFRDDFDKTIEEYISLTKKYKYKCPLTFWKSNESAFPLLAP